MHFALYRATTCINTLLQANAILETVDLMERNALHFAVVSGRLDVVTLVLNKHPNYIHQTGIDGCSPLMWAVRICGRWGTQEDERTKIISELIARGANPHISGEGLYRKWTACDLAYYYGHGRDVIDLLEPKDELVQPGELQDKDLDNQRAAKKIEYSYCDACLLDPSLDGSSSDSDSTEEDTNSEEEGDGSGGGPEDGSGDVSVDGSDDG
ncbi:hypothetical protein QX201_013403 [Fusarium graminearum]